MVSFNPLRWLRPEVKTSAAGPSMSMSKVGQPVWSERDYANFAKEAYLQNAVAYRCIKAIAGGASTVQWLAKSGERDVSSHPILDLISRPSPTIGGATFFEAFFAYLLISGNSYIEAVGPKGKAPRELWTLRPDRVKVIPGPYGLPRAYEYDVSGVKKVWEVDEITGKGPIFHLKEFHPTDDWYGLSRIEPASYAVDRHNAASAHNKALLDNGARPSGALVFKPVGGGANGEGAKSAPAEIIKAAEDRLTERHGGPRNAGRPMVLGGLVDWLEMGLTPKDMDFSAGKEDAARDICTSLGVPHILIVPGSSTYNNIREAKLELWEETILPLVDKVKDGLNTWLAPQFDENVQIEPDLDEIPALEPRRESKRKSVMELVEKGLIDEEEGREALQYGPRKKGAIKKIDASVMTALVNGEDTIGNEPAVRYAHSVGLYSSDTSVEDLITPPLDDLDGIEDEALAGISATDTKADKRSLYVSRNLTNADAFIAWAKAQGFAKTIPASELHVTVAFSKRKVDWTKIVPDAEPLVIKASKNRSVEPLGTEGAVVMLFNSPELQARWKAIRDAGASWDYPSYRPHISITYDGGDIDIDTVEPFPGELRFGPEVFAEIESGAMDRIRGSEKGTSR